MVEAAARDVAPLVWRRCAAIGRRLPLLAARLRRLLAELCGALVAHDARRPRARSCAAAIFRGGGRRPAAAPAMLRRVSGDIVTAGLNSSRVWFGPVPGSP
ncbi:hypothetical protein F511_30938 [Dorcoceras hygrometricum]|uniref:Uncharacterized protein n=1 Tax=Dorcoceras hygrometricum TaxID=472368 RepID=A0A2Z7AMP4_9LAMI|nr:hypothetical protein F511_30938 [Dorcoceras hygrometricum]